jgi:hypothetical protein
MLPAKVSSMMRIRHLSAAFELQSAWESLQSLRRCSSTAAHQPHHTPGVPTAPTHTTHIISALLMLFACPVHHTPSQRFPAIFGFPLLHAVALQPPLQMLLQWPQHHQHSSAPAQSCSSGMQPCCLLVY